MNVSPGLMVKLCVERFNLAKMLNRPLTLAYTIAIAIGLSAPAAARVECVAMGADCDQPCPNCPKRGSPQLPSVKLACCEIRVAPDCQTGEALERTVSAHQLPGLPSVPLRELLAPSDAPRLIVAAACNSPPPSQLNRPLLR